MVVCVAKTNKYFKLRSFDSIEQFCLWLLTSVTAFDKVEISAFDFDGADKD